MAASDEKHEPPAGRGPRRALVRALRGGFQLCFWWLLIVWIVAPERRTWFYVIAVAASAAVAVGVALWPAARRRIGVLRRPARWAELVAWNAVGILALSQLVLVVLGEWIDSPLLAAEDARASARIRHYRYPPGAEHVGFRCNSHGLYDDEFQLERRPGIRRIVAIADSFGVGVVPYEQNFLTLLEHQLSERRPTEVFNFGVMAIGPPDYLHLWSAEAARYDPDLALVCFFVGNDFMSRSPTAILYPKTLRAIALVGRLWQSSETRSGERHEEPFRDPEAATFSAADYLELESERVEVCRREPGVRLRRVFARTEETLGRLHDVIGDRLRIVVIPDEFQVNDALWRQLVDGRENEFDRERPNRWLAERLEARAIPYLDLLEPLREAEREARTYKPRDTHWNRRGNAVAARAIAAWLAAGGW